MELVGQAVLEHQVVGIQGNMVSARRVFAPGNMPNFHLADNEKQEADMKYAMTNMNALRNLLIKQFDEMFASIDGDEIAYLALTSKPEFAIRDRFAWHLQKSSNSNICAREYKRTDLAIISNAGPKLYLEFKAKSAFNFFNKSHEKNNLMRNIACDFKKHRNEPAMNILVCLEAMEEIPSALKEYIKYSRGHDSLKAHNNTFGKIKDVLNAKFDAKGNSYTGCFRGIETKIHVFFLTRKIGVTFRAGRGS